MQMNWVGKSIIQEEWDVLHSSLSAFSPSKEHPLLVYGGGIRACLLIEYMRALGIPHCCVYVKEKIERILDEKVCDINDIAEYDYFCGALVTEAVSEQTFYQLRKATISGTVLVPTYSAEKSYLEKVKNITPDVQTLLMSDCFFANVSVADSSTMSIGYMTERWFSNTVSLALSGMNISGFYHVLRNLNLRNCLPKKLILELTPIAFSPSRAFLPDAQHPELFTEINRFMQDVELEEYCQEVAKRSKSGLKGISFRSEYTVQSLRRDANIFANMYYGYAWDEKCEAVVYLERLLQLCVNNNVQITTILPPANHILLCEYVGKGYLENYHKNCEKIKSITNRYGIGCTGFDTVEFLKSDFADDVLISEALSASGRDKIFSKIKLILQGGVS